jgi:hypothetical protein
MDSYQWHTKNLEAFWSQTAPEPLTVSYSDTVCGKEGQEWVLRGLHKDSGSQVPVAHACTPSYLGDWDQ